MNSKLRVQTGIIARPAGSRRTKFWLISFPARRTARCEALDFENGGGPVPWLCMETKAQIERIIRKRRITIEGWSFSCRFSFCPNSDSCAGAGWVEGSQFVVNWLCSLRCAEKRHTMALGDSCWEFSFCPSKIIKQSHFRMILPQFAAKRRWGKCNLMGFENSSQAVKYILNARVTHFSLEPLARSKSIQSLDSGTMTPAGPYASLKNVSGWRIWRLIMKTDTAASCAK